MRDEGKLVQALPSSSCSFVAISMILGCARYPCSQAEEDGLSARGRNGKPARPRARYERAVLFSADCIRDEAAAGCAWQIGAPQNLARGGIERIRVLMHVAGKHEPALSR